MTCFELFDPDGWTDDSLNPTVFDEPSGFWKFFWNYFFIQFFDLNRHINMGIVVFLTIRWEKLKRNLGIRIYFFFWYLDLPFMFVYNINMNSWTKEYIYAWLVCMNYETWIGYGLLISKNFCTYIIIYMFIQLYYIFFYYIVWHNDSTSDPPTWSSC